MIDRRNFLQITTASALSSMLMLNGCWNSSANDQSEEAETPNFQENGVLRLAFTAQPNTFDPALATVPAEYSIMLLVYNGLISLDDNLEPKPDLAESWEHTDDFLEWTFKLRQNARFHHNDALMTATDVVYTFDRILDPKTSSPLSSVLNFVKSVETLDDHTVRFTLATPNSDFLLSLSAPQAKIVSKEYGPKLLAQKPSGTGQFKFEIYTQGESLILQQYPGYWSLATPYIQKIEYRYISSQELQGTALVNGEIDVIPEASFGQLEGLADYPDIITKQVTSGTHNTIVMRATDPPFDNPLVREALKHCIDRPALLETLLQGHGEVGNDHPVPPFSAYWNDLPQRSYDTDRARELLREAGYPDGLTLDLITSEVSPGMVRLAEEFSQMAEPAGVNIQVTPVSPDIYWTDYWNQHVPFLINSWAFRPSVNQMFMVAYHSDSNWNEARWHTSELDELLELAQAEPDDDRRISLYHEAQRILHDEGAVIIPYFRPLLMLMHKRVYGLVPHPAGEMNIENLRLVVEEDLAKIKTDQLK